MTQEEKQLLLKDLCARLQYNVIIHYHWEKKEDPGIPNSAIVDEDGVLDCSDVDSLLYSLENSQDNWCIIDWKPYLRPMSSMTEKERDELYTAMDWYGEIDETGNVYTKGQEKVYRETFYEYTDWLNAHHFDFRGLIEKGLALEAPEDMYK